jgi:hypothetical protein
MLANQTDMSEVNSHMEQVEHLREYISTPKEYYSAQTKMNNQMFAMIS